MGGDAIARYYSYTSAGTTYTATIYEAQQATRGPVSFQRWYTCAVCAFDYPQSKVVLKGGVAYCIPRRHNEFIEPGVRPRGRERIGG